MPQRIAKPALQRQRERVEDLRELMAEADDRANGQSHLIGQWIPHGSQVKHESIDGPLAPRG